MPSRHLSHPKYRRDIDGLRAIAVLSVVAFHAFPGLIRGGFIGVDVFFVISGFLISSIIFSNLDNGTFSFAEFYVRRVKRIFPALILVLGTCFALGWFVLLTDEFELLGKHIAGGAAFISNLVLLGETGYFDTVADTKPLLHLWSLGVEEQFYIVFPVLFAVAHKKKLNLLSIAVLSSVVSFLFSILIIKNHAVADFYSPGTRCWELTIGSILAWITLYKPEYTAATPGSLGKWLSKAIFRDGREIDGTTLANATSILSLLLLSYGFWHINKNIGFPGKWALIPVFSAVLIIFSGPNAWVNRVILSNRLAVWAGLISFPLYLWHWPLLVFSRIVEGGTASPTIRILAVLLSFILAFLTYRLIEHPIRFGTQKKTIVVMLVLIMTAVGCFGYAAYAQKILPKSKASFSDYTYDLKKFNFIPCSDKLAGGDLGLTYCYSNSTAPTALIIGDSHADDKFYGLSKAVNEEKWLIVANASCPPIKDVQVVSADHTVCTGKIEKYFNIAEENTSIKTVVLSFAQLYPLNEFVAADHLSANVNPNDIQISDMHDTKADKAKSFYNGLDRGIEYLDKIGKKVILLVDIPELTFFPKDCLRSHNACTYNRNDLLKRQALMRGEYEKLKKKYPQILIYDPIDIFCKEDLCQSTYFGRSMYRDSHHLSLYGSEIYGQKFAEWLRTN